MNNKFAILGEIVVSFMTRHERALWLEAHPSARLITPRQFPIGKRPRDAVPAFLYDVISQEFPPDQAEFCIHTMWNNVGKPKKSKQKKG